MPRNWQSFVSEQLSDVQKLVHLAARQDVVSQEKIRTELVKARRRAYEQEISIQAGRVGCAGRQGRLSAGSTLTEFNEQSKTDSESIVNTYNYDLAVAIKAIGTETPTANRHVYARRLQTWETARNQWKAEQIALWTEGTARAQAQRDFYQNNGMADRGVAVLQPRTAKEFICQGWINRGEVPMQEALRNQPPYHQGCPHIFVFQPGRMPRSECESLWIGQ